MMMLLFGYGLGWVSKMIGWLEIGLNSIVITGLEWSRGVMDTLNKMGKEIILLLVLSILNQRILSFLGLILKILNLILKKKMIIARKNFIDPIIF